MTISNKLALMATLIVSMNTFAYDAISLKSEVTNILNFAQAIDQQPTVANKKVAEWLNKGLALNLCNKDDQSRFSENGVIEIARIVENISTTTDAKVASLLTIIANCEAAALKKLVEQLKQTAEQFIEDGKYNRKNAKHNAKIAEKEAQDQRKFAESKNKEAFMVGAMLSTLAILYGALIAKRIGYTIDNYMWKHDTQLLNKVQTMITQATAPKKWFS